MELFGILFDPMAFLRDFGLQILAIVVPIIIYLLYQRKKREFSYTIMSKTRLFTIHDEVRDRLQVLLDRNPIENLYLLIIRFQNSGNESIESEDFETDVLLELNDEAQIISNEVIETIPNELNYKIYGEHNKLRLSPTLFNESDSIIIKMLISEFKEIKSVTGRIVGVLKIKELMWNPSLDRKTRTYGLILFILMVFLYLKMPFNNMVFSLILIFYGIFGFGAILFPQRFRIVFDINGKERRPRFLDD